ncbi:MarR family winged helix-turn-helix transcriptional regulator [Streptomyces sp. NPDC050528]|uniref:MarR family winged helix-turn-helix transcriptional regulator n=1 Tax=Streptomyces sp. NPDC050528 TaxID=3365623 RepID=UPI0037953D93
MIDLRTDELDFPLYILGITFCRAELAGDGALTRFFYDERSSPSVWSSSRILSAGRRSAGVSRHADRLEAAGLIERSPDPSDRRATLLAMTPKGRTAVTGLRDALTRRLSSG